MVASYTCCYKWLFRAFEGAEFRITESFLKQVRSNGRLRSTDDERLACFRASIGHFTPPTMSREDLPQPTCLRF